MRSKRLRIVRPEAIKELRSRLEDDSEFFDEDSVYDYEDTLDIYSSLLMKALGISGKRLSDVGLKGVLAYIVDRLSLEGDVHQAALEIADDIDALHEMANDYIGRPALEGTLDEADGHRQRIVDTLGDIVGALESAG